jgi:hypothetical protein
LHGAVGQFGARGERPHYHEAALEVLHAVGGVGAHSSASEEVDYAFFEDVGGLGFFAGGVFFDGISWSGVGLGGAIGFVGCVLVLWDIAVVDLSLDRGMLVMEEP